MPPPCLSYLVPVVVCAQGQIAQPRVRKKGNSVSSKIREGELREEQGKKNRKKSALKISCCGRAARAMFKHKLDPCDKMVRYIRSPLLGSSYG